MQQLHLIVHHLEVAAKVVKCPVLVFVSEVFAALVAFVQAKQTLKLWNL
jgi:hypothetical protein